MCWSSIVMQVVLHCDDVADAAACEAAVWIVPDAAPLLLGIAFRELRNSPKRRNNKISYGKELNQINLFGESN